MACFPRIRVPLLVLLSGLFVAMSAQGQPVKLAVLMALSSTGKNVGATYKEGLLVGLQEEAAAHNVDWQSWITLEFLDDRDDKGRALQLAKDVIASGARAILGCTSSAVGVHIRDYILDEAGVPFIVLGCTSDKLRTQHPLFIRMSLSIPLRTAALANWLTAHPFTSSTKPRWGCIHMDYNWGVGACNAFKQLYSPVGEEIGRVPTPLKTLNKKKEIVQLAKLEPDFALAVFRGAEAQVFFQDYYRFQVHRKIPLVVFEVSVTPNLLQAYEKTLAQYGTGVGLIAAETYTPTADTLVNQHFVTLVQQTYKRLPSVRHVRGYDTGRLLIKALVELDGKWDGAKVVQLMKTLPYTSPRQTPPLQFDTHGDIIQGAHITKIKREGNRLVKENIAEVPPINMDEVLK